MNKYSDASFSLYLHEGSIGGCGNVGMCGAVVWMGFSGVRLGWVPVQRRPCQVAELRNTATALASIPRGRVDKAAVAAPPLLYRWLSLISNRALLATIASRFPALVRASIKLWPAGTFHGLVTPVQCFGTVLSAHVGRPPAGVGCWELASLGGPHWEVPSHPSRGNAMGACGAHGFFCVISHLPADPQLQERGQHTGLAGRTPVRNLHDCERCGQKDPSTVPLALGKCMRWRI